MGDSDGAQRDAGTVGSPPALEVRGLVVRYGSVAAVDGLDLSVASGSVLALLGPNASGAPDGLRARVGVMPQGGGAYPGVRVREMVGLVAACAADPLDPDWLIETLGLAGCARTPYKRLSVGQQQRLALACALVGRPELVFLDEPTANLDPQGRHLVWSLIQALRADGVAVVLTTHLMGEAEALADQIVIIDHGRVVAAGTPAELTACGAEQELRFRAAPQMDLNLLTAALPEGCAVAETSAGSYLVQGTIDPQVLSTVTSWCARQGVLADDLRVARRSLEDVFLELTGRELRS